MLHSLRVVMISLAKVDRIAGSEAPAAMKGVRLMEITYEIMKELALDAIKKTAGETILSRIDHRVEQMFRLTKLGCMTDLARKIGCSRSAISRVIHEKEVRYGATGVLVCQAFEVSIGWQIDHLAKRLAEKKFLIPG